jgi:hypothetical protein
MNCRVVRVCNYLFVAAQLFVFTTRQTQASDISQLSGSYQIVQKTDLGPQTHVRLQVHLINHWQRELHIRTVALGDLSHPGKGGMQACSIVVHAGASSDTTQEFTIPHSEYELWRRGTRPRMVLEIELPSGHQTTMVVRLGRVSDRKVD